MKNCQVIITAMIATLICFLLSCNTPFTSPRKKGYFKISFPEKAYRVFDSVGYPYSFEYPTYAVITKDSSFFDSTAGDYWINIDIPQFNGRIYVSYKPVTTTNYESLVNDGFKMAYKQHMDVAPSIAEEQIHTSNGVGGMYFSLKGNTATANQFFLTDSTKNFFRGALYFNAPPNEDSIKIVNDFLRKDLMHLINTFKWK